MPRTAWRLERQVWGRVLPTALNSTACHHLTPGSSAEPPVFVLPVLTWHVGHLLIDVLEPLHHAMAERFGGEKEQQPAGRLEVG